ncbi:unnamed protein product, partial [marine sediment metagenome]
MAGLANDMYEQLHPGEDISTSKLSVREATRASVNLSSDFYGHEEHPLLHYSESHLDTLGLCYFLAIRKRESQQNPNFKLLVLDDVLYSVDAQHRSRFANLLKDNFNDHQILITTHDPVFYDKLRQTLGGNEVEYVRLTNWDIERGPTLGDPSTDLDRIVSEQQRQTKSTEELSGAGGRFMEMLLMRLTERLLINVPAKFESRYTIND